MIRVLLVFALLTLWSCTQNSQEAPAPPPESPAAPLATVPEKPASKVQHSNPGEADLGMAISTADLELVSKTGVLNKDGVVVQGKIRNNTSKTYQYVEVSIKLLDAAGRK